MKYLATILLTLVATMAHNHGFASELKVVASIRPVHSLVSSLMQGVATPRLLMQRDQSPHHYALRPSERRAVAEADLIVWIGPELEAFLPRMISDDTRSLPLLQSRGTELLASQVRDQDHEHDHGNVDPHIWLSVTNVRVMIDSITQTLIELDAENAVTYQNNEKSLLAKIDGSLGEIRVTSETPFIVMHDSIRYFVAENGLQQHGSVSNGKEIATSVRHTKSIISKIRQEEIACLIYDASHRSPMIDMLQRETAINAIEIDPMGSRHDPGPSLWLQLMLDLAGDISSCLLTDTR